MSERQYKYRAGLACIFAFFLLFGLMSFGYYWKGLQLAPEEEEKPKPSFILQAEGFSMNITLSIEAVDRSDILVTPNPAQAPVTPHYHEGGFESPPSVEWYPASGTSAQCSTNYAYQGIRSWEQENLAGSVATTEIQNPACYIPAGQSADLIFYMLLDRAFNPTTDYHIAFWLQCNYYEASTTTFYFSNLLVVLAGTFTPASPITYAYHTLTMSNTPVKDLWTGFLIQDLRSQLTCDEILGTGTTINLGDPFPDSWQIDKGGSDLSSMWHLESRTQSGAPELNVYVDDFEMYTTPTLTELATGRFRESVALVTVTDYQLSIDYTITIDENLITDSSTVELQIDLYTTITATTSIPRRLVEHIVLGSFTFTSGVSSGSKTGILHPLPPDDTLLGDTLTYSFDAYLRGDAHNSVSATDIYAERTITNTELGQDFQVYWSEEITL